MTPMDETAAIAHTAPVDPSEVENFASTFEVFVDAQTARFHGALRLLTRDRAEAEDLMQDAYLRVWERVHYVRSLDDPTGYLYRTAMNLYRKRLRRATVALRHAIRPRPARDPLDDVESRDEDLRALATLSPRQRTSLVLTDPRRCVRLGHGDGFRCWHGVRDRPRMRRPGQTCNGTSPSLVLVIWVRSGRR